MIVFIGDLHAEFTHLKKMLENIPRNATLIQIGDFGFWDQYRKLWETVWPTLGFDKPMYAIDGNHEFFPILRGIEEITEVWPGVTYIPRGTVLDIEEVKMGFIGGAASIDYKSRMLGIDWFTEEVISPADYEKMIGAAEYLDLLVTHTPPRSVIAKHFDDATKEWFGLPRTWQDPSSVAIDAIWEKYGKCPLICGHMHRKVIDGNCRILAVDEVFTFKS
jgi:Icc-related predicted phosphoesterase